MTWIKIHDGLDYEQATERARHIQRYDDALKAAGGCANYEKVEIRRVAGYPQGAEYAVWGVRHDHARIDAEADRG